MEKICFVKSSQKLPPDYEAGNIRILCHNFSVNAIEVRVGDQVSFELRKKDTNTPIGIRPQVVKYSNRTFGEVQQFLSNCYKSLQSNSASTIISLLSPNNKAVWNFLVSLEISSDIHIRIIFKIFDCFRLIAKHSEHSRHEKRSKDLLALLLDGSAFSQLIEKNINADRKASVLNFCDTVYRLLPSYSYAVYPLIKKLTAKRDVDEDMKFLLHIISNIFGACKSRRVTKQAILPSSKELVNAPLDESSYLEPVRFGKPYNSFEEYEDTYYYLLRAEAFSAIQDGVVKQKAKTLDLRDMNVFTDVVLASVQIYGKSLCFGMKFQPAKKVTTWKSSSQLMLGNLLCLSPRCNFRDPIWAVVAERDIDLLEKERMILIKFLEDNCISLGEILAELISHSGKIVMVESPTYYEAIRSSLKIFRTIKLKDYLLSNDIVFGYTKEEIPKYLECHSPPDMSNTLDNSQAEAFDFCMKNKVAIIQGPPGTGKTFVGFHIAKYILSLGIEGPILMLSHKNHALDEFLLKILDICNKRDVVRIGGQSKEPKLDDILLYKLITRSNSVNFEILEEHCNNLKKMAESFASSAILGFDNFIETLSEEQKYLFLSKNNYGIVNADAASFEEWCPKHDYLKNLGKPEGMSMTVISNENINEGEDEEMIKNIENDRVFTKQGAGSTSTYVNSANKLYFNFKNVQNDGYKLANLPEGCVLTEGILSTKNLWDLDNTERIQFIYALLKKNKDEFEKKIEETKSIIEEEISCSFDNDTLQKFEKLKEMKVIGATITGAAFHHELLHAVKPKVVIVEEAAEILEPFLVAAINPEVEHLILIGDHKQLRPHVDTFKLVKEYNFDVSMMERLIKIEYPYKVLKKQGRMRSEFAELMTDIYPSYESFDNINHCRLPFPYFSKSMYFWSHSHAETKDRSCKNMKEAEMALSIAYFLIACGVKPESITILAAYETQLRVLKSIYREEKSKSKAIRNNDIIITTIDLYQGDENDFVIISLVRSNNDGNIGFLKNRKRRCVAQSRARRGMYFVGNVSCFRANSTWSDLIKSMDQRGCIGNNLIVKCDNPKHTMNQNVSSSYELSLITKNLGKICPEKCAFTYDGCGHPCTKKCKPSHNHNECIEKVQYQVPDCKHRLSIECHQERKGSTILCKHKVKYICNQKHSSIVLCDDMKKGTAKCDNPCEKKMKCLPQNPCKKTCGESHDHVECNILVPYTFTRCGHKSEDMKKCTQIIENKCEVEVEFEGSCGHPITGKCYAVYGNKSSIPCRYPCTKILQCKHPCPRYCSKPCPSRCAVCEKQEEDRIEEYHRQVTKKIETLKQSKDSFVMKPLADKTPEYQSIVDKVMKYIQPMHNWYPKVTEIMVVTNTKLEKKFWTVCRNGYGMYVDHKFHKDCIEHVKLKEIAEDGFKLPTKAAMHGKGIYLCTDSSKSAKEIDAKTSKRLLLCEVFLGKSYAFEDSAGLRKFRRNESWNYGKRFLREKKCDSIYAPRNEEVKHDEFIVFNPDQVFPNYIISFEVEQVARHRPSVNGFEKHRYKFSRNVNTSDPYYLEASVAVAHYNRTNREKDIFNTDEIDIIRNSTLESRFEDMKEKFQRKDFGDEILAFHATDPENIDSILRNNLDPNRQPAHGRLHGDGCYFSEFPDFSARYGDSMIMFRVLPGKEYSGNGTLPQIGYDSKKVKENKDGYGEQLIIQNASQFLPAYVFYKKMSAT